jgi:hypothetical protein
MDPDPGGPKTYGFDGSGFGSATLVINNLKNTSSYSILKYVPDSLESLPLKKSKDQCKKCSKKSPKK